MDVFRPCPERESLAPDGELCERTFRALRSLVLYASIRSSALRTGENVRRWIGQGPKLSNWQR